MAKIMNSMWCVEPGVIEMREKPVYQIGPKDVLVKIAYSGICPWDLRVYLGKKNVPLPRILGHEIAGIVTEVGSDVKDLEIGTPVVGDFIVKCGVCKNCRNERENKCLNPTFLPGGYAEYAAFPRKNIHPIKPGVSLKAAAFTEPLATVFRGQTVLRLKPGETEVVVGVGPIGQLHAQVAKAYGARVIAVDLIQERLDLAKKLGADAIVNSSQHDMVAAIEELTDGKGADAAVVAVPSSPLVSETAKALAIGGRLNIFAGIYPVDPISIDPNLIHYKELNILGSADSTSTDFYKALKMIEDGTIKVEPLISHLLPLNKLQEGLDIVAKCQGLKVMFEVGGEEG
ncbi:MAG: hypothetical protein APF76_06385 [Desulfitibacter sp. BRH_c19]|nr:MAG: hypothetical protein APF76_06385 [Desulfitibacter sp. BRH_c19]